MTKEGFIEALTLMSDQEITEYIKSKGKPPKKITLVMFLPK